MSDGRIIIDSELNNTKLETQLSSMNGTMTSEGTQLGDSLSKGMETGSDSGGTKVVQSLSTKLANAAPKMEAIGKKMTLGITTPVVAGFTKMSMAASDYDENMNKVDVAFGSSAGTVKKWSNTALTQFGLSKNAALEMTSQFGDMGTSMGLTQSEAANMSTSMAGLAGDLASFKNISTDQAMTALNGVFTGETESLKTLGIVMTETNLKQFAEDQGLVYDAMSQSEKVQLRYNYVMTQTKNAQGDYARTSDGTANSMRTFTQSLENLCITLGQNLLPIITPIIQKLTSLVQKFGEAPPSVQKTVLAIMGIAAAVGPALIAFAKVATAIDALKKLSFITKIIGPLKAAFSGLFTLIAANPIVAAIMGIIAVFVLLYTKCEPFRNFINGMFETIKNAVIAFGEKVKAVFTAIVEFFTSIPEKLGAIWETVKSAASKVGQVLLLGILGPIPLIIEAVKKIGPDIVQGLLSLVDSVLNAAKNIGNTILNGFQSVVSGAKEIGSKIGSVFSSGISGAKSLASKAGNFIKNAAISALSGVANVASIGADVVRGLWNGISNKVEWLKSKIKGFVGNVKNFLKNLFGVHSPSTFTTWIGEMLDEGLAGGIKDKTKDVLYAVKAQSNAIKDAYNTSSAIPTTIGVGATSNGASANSSSIVNNVQQEFVFNEPVYSPADTARAVKNQAIKIGLAGV